MNVRKLSVAGLACLALAACGTTEENNASTNNTSTNNTATNNTSTNNTNTGNPLTCDGDFGAADACGGALNGVWTVNEACTNFDYAGTIQGACASMVVDDAVVTATGTLTIAGNAWTQAIQGNIALTMSTPDACGLGSCTVVQAALGTVAADANCVSDGGAGCDCSASVDAADVSAGTFTTAGGIATINTGETYYYCVSGGTMLLREFGTAADEAVATIQYDGP